MIEETHKQSYSNKAWAIYITAITKHSMNAHVHLCTYMYIHCTYMYIYVHYYYRMYTYMYIHASTCMYVHVHVQTL